MTHDEKTIRFVIVGIIGTLFVTAIGSFVLAFMKIQTPDHLAMLSTTLAGGLLGILAKTSSPPKV